MKITKFAQIVALTAGLTCAGCATANSLNRLSIGMTKQEAISIMGEPESTASPGNGVEILRYRLSRAGSGGLSGALDVVVGPAPSNRPQEYFLRLLNGRLDSYGMVGDFDSTKDPTLNLNIRNR